MTNPAITVNGSPIASLILLILIPTIAAAAWHWHAAYTELRGLLPRSYDDTMARMESQYVVWTPRASDEARRHYVLAEVLAGIFAVELAAMMLTLGQPWAAALFAAIGTAALCHIMLKRRRFLAREPKHESKPRKRRLRR